MKKYRHKITGDWVEKSNEHYYKMQSDGRTIPVRLIEGCNDWEEMQVKNLCKPCVIKSVCVCKEPEMQTGFEGGLWCRWCNKIMR